MALWHSIYVLHSRCKASPHLHAFRHQTTTARKSSAAIDVIQGSKGETSSSTTSWADSTLIVKAFELTKAYIKECLHDTNRPRRSRKVIESINQFPAHPRIVFSVPRTRTQSMSNVDQ